MERGTRVFFGNNVCYRIRETRLGSLLGRSGRGCGVWLVSGFSVFCAASSLCSSFASSDPFYLFFVPHTLNIRLLVAPGDCLPCECSLAHRIPLSTRPIWPHFVRYVCIIEHAVRHRFFRRIRVSYRISMACCLSSEA